MIKHPNITVLYLDDEKDNLFIFEANFNEIFHVITSTSPTTALEKLDTHYDDIIAVISDMRMPTMNGVEFIKKAKSQYNKVFYYILTGFGQNDEIEEAISNHLIHKCFTKPFDAEEIESTILGAASSLRR